MKHNVQWLIFHHWQEISSGAKCTTGDEKRKKVIVNVVPNINFDGLEPGELLVCSVVMKRDLRRLASAVILEAIRSLVKKGVSFEDQLDAFMFLTGPDLEVWQDWAGMRYMDPYEVLTRPRQETIKIIRRLEHGR